MLHEILAAQFRKTTYATPKEFWRQSKMDLSEETVSRCIGRGHEPGIGTFVAIAYHLGMEPKEIASACKKAGDRVFCRLIIPSSLDGIEQAVLDRFQRIPEGKRQVVLDLLEAMGE